MTGLYPELDVLAVFIIAFACVLLVYLSVGMAFLAGLFLPTRPRQERQPMVTVIVAARNEAAHLRAILDSLSTQTYPAHLLEFIVVDDRSEDDTGRLMTEWASQRTNARAVRIDATPAGVSGKKHALDMAVRQARGELFLFTDADCVVPPTWVTSMTSYFSEDVGFVIGFSLIRASTWFQRLQRLDFLTMMSAAAGAANLGFPMAASGQNLAYRKKAWQEAGGFDRIKHRLSGDDVLMMHQIRALRKWKIVFASSADAHVTTRPEPTLQALLNQRSRWASNADMMWTMNPLFLVYLVSVYGLNLMLIGGSVSIMIWEVPAEYASLTCFGWLNKFVVDFAVSVMGHRYFGQPFPSGRFLAWFIAHPFYLILVGFLGPLKQFKWR